MDFQTIKTYFDWKKDPNENYWEIYHKQTGNLTGCIIQNKSDEWRYDLFYVSATDKRISLYSFDQKDFLTITKVEKILKEYICEND